MESDNGIKALKCPDCGASINWEQDKDEMICPYCHSSLTFKNLKIVNVKDNLQTYDINNADPGTLSKLESYISSVRYKKINLNAIRLLKTELGPDNYRRLLASSIKLTGSDGNLYIVNNEGYIQVTDREGKEIKDGQMIPEDGYPVGDMFVTLIKYIKFNAQGLNRAWGCGKLSFRGGEISVD